MSGVGGGAKMSGVDGPVRSVADCVCMYSNPLNMIEPTFVYCVNTPTTTNELRTPRKPVNRYGKLLPMATKV